MHVSIIKQEIYKQKVFLQTRECGVVFLKLISGQNAQAFSGVKIYDVLILPLGQQADDLCMS